MPGLICHPCSRPHGEVRQRSQLQWQVLECGTMWRDSDGERSVFRGGDLLHATPVTHDLLDEVAAVLPLATEKEDSDLESLYGRYFGRLPANLFITCDKYELVLTNKRQPLGIDSILRKVVGEMHDVFAELAHPVRELRTEVVIEEESHAALMQRLGATRTPRRLALP